MTYLKDNSEAYRVIAQSSRYWLSPDQILYKRSYLGPYLRCAHPRRVPDVLFEIHEGSCDSHTGGRFFAHKARSQGYWWPFMQKDVISYVCKCDKCQKHSPIMHQPSTELNSINSHWPFTQWGLDILGPFPKGS